MSYQRWDLRLTCRVGEWSSLSRLETSSNSQARVQSTADLGGLMVLRAAVWEISQPLLLCTAKCSQRIEMR